MLRLFAGVLTAALSASTLQAQAIERMPLDHAAYEEWKAIEDEALSKDGAWLYPDSATPGDANRFTFRDEIVISEIAYNPPALAAIPDTPATFENVELFGFDVDWRYNDADENLPAYWAGTAHAVGGNWKSAGAPIGRETGSLPAPLVTDLDPTYVSSTVTYYFEREFDLTAQQFADLDSMEITHQIDDGAIFYINGVEVGTFNISSGAGPETLASPSVGNATLVAIKPGTGEILAMLGSLDYRDETIDGNVNVALSPQQPGSAIKVLTYAAALSNQLGQDRGSWTAADILWDVPVEYSQYDGTLYEPVNYDLRFHGPVRLRDALANSYNVPAVLLLQDIGIPSVLELAGQLGISSFDRDPQRYGLSLTLGGGEVSPLELTSAYAVFANGGYRLPPAAILRVEDGSGAILYEYQPAVPEPALDPRVAYIISDILDDDAARIPAMGRDNPLDLPFPAAAKTGTSNEARDNWTVGYTPGLAVGVWAGNSDNSETQNVSGLTAAAPLWSAYMQAIYSDPELVAVLNSNGARPPDEFVAPPGLEKRQICDLTTVAPGAAVCALTDAEWFLANDADTGSERDTQSVRWEEVDPAVWRVPAVPLPPLSETFEIAVSEDILPPQAFCHFEDGTGIEYLPADALASLFLSPPRNSESLIEAHRWAIDHGLPILPAEPCTDELLAAARDPEILAIWRITSPKMGDKVNGVVPIVGTADFDPDKVQFYKLELGIGNPENPEWVTLGEARDTPVVNGTLEMLHADALPAGDYLLRLIVVKWDGNYVGEPHTVQVTIQ